MALIETLPVELLQEIMKYHANMATYGANKHGLTAPAVEAVLALSRRLWAVASETPEYWQDILVTPATVDQAYLWATRARQRHLRVVVQFRPDSPVDELHPEIVMMLECLKALAPACDALALHGETVIFEWFTEPDVAMLFSSVQALSLSWPGLVLDRLCSPPGRHHPAVDWIDLHVLSLLPKLSVLDLELPHSLVAIPLAITSLHIAEGPRTRGSHAQELAHMLEALPALQSLYIQGSSGWFCTDDDNWDVTELNLPQLICLELNPMDDRLRVEHLKPLRCFLNAVHAPLLDRLRLNGICLDLGEDLAINLHDMSTKFPKLRRLMLCFTYGRALDILAILQKFSGITELVIWHWDSPKELGRISVAKIYAHGLLPKLSMLRLMDATLSMYELGMFLQHRAVHNLSLPKLECAVVLENDKPMTLDEIYAAVMDWKEWLCDNHPEELMKGDMFPDIETAKGIVGQWFSDVEISLQPDVPEFMMDEFARFSPERLAGSRRLLWEEAGMGLGVNGTEAWDPIECNYNVLGHVSHVAG